MAVYSSASDADTNMWLPEGGKVLAVLAGECCRFPTVLCHYVLILTST
jgi:hypothetical protein